MSATVDAKVTQIRQAVYGEEVREAIASAIEVIDDVAEGAESSATTAAETAVAAKNAAVDAKDAAVTAKNAAVDAKDAAVSAKNTAVDAKDAAVSAKNDAVSAKNDAVTAKNAAVAAKDTAVAAADALMLNLEEIPDTVQTYTFTSGTVSKIEHKRSGSAVRTDTFSYGANTITEVRTLASGDTLTIVTNLTTLETTVTYAAA